MTDYTKIEGTETSATQPHEPRTLVQTTVDFIPSSVDLESWEPGEDVDADALVREELLARRQRSSYIMSEIGDGVFVQWGTCSTCNKRVDACTCKTGPVEPEHIKRWREGRFDPEISTRLPRPKEPEVELDPETGEGLDDTTTVEEYEAWPGNAPLRHSDEQEASDIRQNVDDGLNRAHEAVATAMQDLEESVEREGTKKKPSEEDNDVGF